MPHVKYCDIERLGTPENSSMFDHSDDETDAILKNHKDISLGTMKGLVAKKCLEMIDSMMVKQ